MALSGRLALTVPEFLAMMKEVEAGGYVAYLCNKDMSRIGSLDYLKVGQIMESGQRGSAPYRIMTAWESAEGSMILRPSATL